MAGDVANSSCSCSCRTPRDRIHHSLFRPELTAPAPDDLAVKAAASRLVACCLLGVNQKWIPADEGRPLGVMIHGADYLDQLLGRLATHIVEARRRWHSDLLKESWPAHQALIIETDNELLAAFRPRLTF